MHVVGFGTYDRARHPRVAVLLDGLAERGNRVTEVNEPIGFSTAERVAMLTSSASSWRLLTRMLGCWRRLVHDTRPMRRDPGGRPEVVLVGYLGHFDVILARVLFRHSLIVLDQLVFAADTARDRGVRARWKLALLALLDRIALRCSQVIVLDTPEGLALVPRRRRQDAVVVPVGTGPEWFDARRPDPDPTLADLSPTDPKHDQLRVVFFGLFTPLQGTTTIADAMDRLADRPDIHFTVAGAGQDYAQARRIAARNEHARWVDWVDPIALPDLVAGHDVCLGIFGSTAKAQRVVPTKVYQGAAAGCAIVTSDTPAQRRTCGDAALYIRDGDGAALAAALRLLAADPDLLATYRRRARERAERFRGAEVVTALDQRLHALLSAGPSIVPGPDDEVGQ